MSKEHSDGESPIHRYQPPFLQVIPQTNAKDAVFCFWANEGMLDPAQMSHLWGPRAGNLEKITGNEASKHSSPERNEQ